MSAGRIALIAVGFLIAAGALFLVVRGFRGAEAAPAAAAEAPEKTAAGGRPEEKEPPPKWQSFLRPDERKTPPRPVVRSVQDLPNPFDRLPNGGGGGDGGDGGESGAKPANPGFRLEGISVGAQTVALISGHAVREGDAISGFRVLRIGRSAVTLAGPQGARLDLALGGAGQ